MRQEFVGFVEGRGLAPGLVVLSQVLGLVSAVVLGPLVCLPG